MKQIEILDRSGWPWSEVDINIQRFELEDGEKHLLWCNHASTEIEDDTVELCRPDGPDIVHYVKYEVCIKCSAYREISDDFDDEWHDAPPKYL